MRDTHNETNGLGPTPIYSSSRRWTSGDQVHREHSLRGLDDEQRPMVRGHATEPETLLSLHTPRAQRRRGWRATSETLL